MTATYPRRGQVWEYVHGSRQYRVLVVSNDRYNELPRATPWVLTVDRDAPRIPGHLIEMVSGDPLPGAVVVIPRILRCDPTALRHNLGFVTEDTLRAVERGLREFLDLP